MSGFEDEFNEPEDFGLGPDPSDMQAFQSNGINGEGNARRSHQSAGAGFRDPPEDALDVPATRDEGAEAQDQRADPGNNRQEDKSSSGDAGGGQQDARESLRSVTISNLQWWTTDVELELLCGKYGEVTGLKFVEERSNCKSKGQVFLEFVDAEAARKCKEEMNGLEVNGKTCSVSIGSPKAKFYFQQHTGRMAGHGNSYRDGMANRYQNRHSGGGPAPPFNRGRGRPGGRYGNSDGHMNGMPPNMISNPGMNMPGPGMFGMGMPGIMGMPGPMGMGGMPMGPMGMPPFSMPGMFPPMPNSDPEEEKERKGRDGRDRRDHREAGDGYRDRDYDRDRDYKRHRH